MARLSVASPSLQSCKPGVPALSCPACSQDGLQGAQGHQRPPWYVDSGQQSRADHAVSESTGGRGQLHPGQGGSQELGAFSRRQKSLAACRCRPCYLPPCPTFGLVSVGRCLQLSDLPCLKSNAHPPAGLTSAPPSSTTSPWTCGPTSASSQTAAAPTSTWTCTAEVGGRVVGWLVGWLAGWPDRCSCRQLQLACA